MIEYRPTPELPWRSFAANATGSRAGQSPGASRITTDIAANATSFSVTTTAPGLPWSTTAGTLLIVVAGEQMLATVSGTGLVQTFSVTRAQNGINKILPAGSEVQLVTPMRAIY